MAQNYTSTPVLSKVKLGEQTYFLKDADVRSILDTFGSIVTYDVALTFADDDKTVPTGAAIADYVENQITGLSGAMHFVGATAKQEGETDEDALNRLVPAPENGDVAIIDTAEYVYANSKWVLFGDEGVYLTIAGAQSTYVQKTFTIAGIDLQDNIAAEELKTALSLGALAYKNSATATLTDYATGISGATYTPAGSVDVTLTQTATEIASTGNFTPSGSVSGNVTAAGSVAITKDNANGVEITGTVSTPTITVTPSNTTIKGVTNAGTLPSYTPATYTAPSVTEAKTAVATAGLIAAMDGTDTEMLVLTAASTAEVLTGTGFDAGSFTDGTLNPGALPTLTEDTTVVTGITGATASQPVFTGDKFGATFTGTQTDISATFSGTEGQVSVNGNYDKATVGGTGFTGTEATITPTLTTGNKEVTVQ